MKAAESRNGGAFATEERPRSVFDSSQLWTAQQLSKVLQVPVSWIYEQSRIWVESDGARGIPTVTLGKYRRYRPVAIRDYLERLERVEVKS